MAAASTVSDAATLPRSLVVTTVPKLVSAMSERIDVDEK